VRGKDGAPRPPLIDNPTSRFKREGALGSLPFCPAGFLSPGSHKTAEEEIARPTARNGYSSDTPANVPIRAVREESSNTGAEAMGGEETRRARIAANEAVFRTVNEQIEDLNRMLGQAVGDDSMAIICECGDVGCTEQITIPVDAYEEARSDPTHFIIVPGHEITDVEDIVARHGNFNVVCKHKGSGKTVAEATDLRS
jgi:hypothetical protein